MSSFKSWRISAYTTTIKRKTNISATQTTKTTTTKRIKMRVPTRTQGKPSAQIVTTLSTRMA